MLSLRCGCESEEVVVVIRSEETGGIFLELGKQRSSQGHSATIKHTTALIYQASTLTLIM